MTLGVAAIPLALLAGVLGVLSPCVWPMVPVVTSAASVGGARGQLALALGLSVSFAVSGSLATWVLVGTGLDPELLRYVSAGLLIALAVTLLFARAGEWVALRLSFLSSRFGPAAGATGASARGQFAVGAMLGFIWLPCVGPTLGAAIALASLGQQLVMGFLVMLAYGVGTAGVLLVAGRLSHGLLLRWRPRVLAGGGSGKRALGFALLVLGLLVVTGADKVLEALAVNLLPAWATSL